MVYHERLLEFPSVREILSARCVSDMGRRRVEELHPTADVATLYQAIGLVREMMALFAARQDPPIHGLRDVSANLKKVARERAILEPSELLELRDFCDTAGRMRRFFEPLQVESSGLASLAMPLYGVPALVQSIDEKIAPNSTVRDNASEALARLRADIRVTEEQIQKVLQRLSRQFTDSGDLQEDFVTLRNDRYVLPVKSTNRGKVKGIIHDSSNTGETVFIEPFEVLEQSNKLADLRLSEKEEIFRILLRVAGHVRDELNSLITNEQILSEFDIIYAKAQFGAACNCSFPHLSGIDAPMNLVEAHHPLLFASQPKTSRPLNMGLDMNDRVLIITGPNAGGKTTALKTIGLIAMMVQCAIPVPVSSRSRMPVFRHVLADIGDEQSLLEGFSTFSARMRRMVEIHATADDSALVLLDELGTATDPAEGGALGVAILESLAERGAITIVSTHLSALKNWAHEYQYGRNASFRLSEQDHRPTFRLSLDLPGISEALIVAEQVGMPREIIERARALRPESELDATALLLSLQEKEQKLVDQLKENERLHLDLEEKERELRRFDEQLREEKRKYKNQMLEEKERGLREMRARVEAMIGKLPSKQELVEAKRDLEQQISTAEEDRRETKREGAAVVLDELKPGDHVRVKSLNEEGEIREVMAKRGEARVYVRNMTVAVKATDLQRVAKKDEAVHEEGTVHYHRPSDMSNSLDLHGKRVDEAVTIVDKFMDNALAAGLSWVRVVHGHGSGALRRALHDHFKLHPQVKGFRHGAPNEGGGSVTVVEFK